MARKPKRGQSRPPLLIACGLLVILLRFFPGEQTAVMPDLPAADEPAAIPLPVEQALVAESVALGLPQAQPEPELPTQPVYVADTREYHSAGAIYFKNETDYPIDLPALLAKNSPVALGTEGVQVLIMHTHGTEAYTPSAAHPYTPSGEYRTTDGDANMLRVGREIAAILNERGISTVHSTTLNDYPAYNGSYNRALKDIQKYVEQYPTIRLVIDVHRDAIATGNTYYKTAAVVDGQPTAQLMFVTGTDAGGLSHPNWRDNLAFQALLHDRMNSLYPGIMRPMSIRASRFNQHIRAGSMLVEVGACGNTLEEALAAARIFANTLADTLLQQ